MTKLGKGSGLKHGFCNQIWVQILALSLPSVSPHLPKPQFLMSKMVTMVFAHSFDKNIQSLLNARHCYSVVNRIDSQGPCHQELYLYLTCYFFVGIKGTLRRNCLAQGLTCKGSINVSHYFILALKSQQLLRPISTYHFDMLIAPIRTETID